MANDDGKMLQAAGGAAEQERDSLMVEVQNLRKQNRDQQE